MLFFFGSADFFFSKKLFQKNVQLYHFTLAANFVLFLPTPTCSAAHLFKVQFFQSANKNMLIRLCACHFDVRPENSN